MFSHFCRMSWPSRKTKPLGMRLRPATAYRSKIALQRQWWSWCPHRGVRQGNSKEQPSNTVIAFLSCDHCCSMFQLIKIRKYCRTKSLIADDFKQNLQMCFTLLSMIPCPQVLSRFLRHFLTSTEICGSKQCGEPQVTPPWSRSILDSFWFKRLVLKIFLQRLNNFQPTRIHKPNKDQAVQVLVVFPGPNAC